MSDRRSRRTFLAASGTAGLALTAGCIGTLGDGGGSIGAEGALAVEATAQFRSGLRRQGVYPDASVPAEPAVEWVVRDVNTGDHTAAKASPVATPDGDVVISGDSGVLRRVTPAGEVVWATRLTTASRGMHGTAAIADGVAYVGAYDGACNAVDLETGERVWRRRLGGAIGSSPGYRDGTVYIAVEYRGPDGSLVALDAATGRPEWVDSRPADHPHSTCAIDRGAGRLLVGANDGTLYAWTYPALEFAWSFETDGPIKGPIATGDGKAFFGSWDRIAYAVALDEGTEVWSFDADGLVMTGPSVELATGTVYVGSHDTNLYALELETGAARWRYGSGGRLIGCPSVTAEHVLVGSYDGYLHAVGKSDGEHAWRVAGVGRVTSTPLVLDGAVYFADRASEGHLQSEDGPTGGLYKVGSAG